VFALLIVLESLNHLPSVRRKRGSTAGWAAGQPTFMLRFGNGNMRLNYNPIFRLFCSLPFLLTVADSFGQTAAVEQKSPTNGHDGQHDFDFVIGSWRIHNRRLRNPLTGSTTWVEFEGHSVSRQVWGGQANVDQNELDDPSGRIEGMTLRLYDPTTHLWSLYWANSKQGSLVTPTIGQFANGHGEFYDYEVYQGKAVLVRFLWLNIKPDSSRWEQAFSPDGGKTWETNWTMDFERSDTPNAQDLATEQKTASVESDGQHDFDFLMGSWKIHCQRLRNPLTRSTTWVDFDGTVVAHSIWGGRANFDEGKFNDPSGQIQGMTLRLYDPTTHLWSLYWATSKQGTVTIPTIGRFTNGRGEFYDYEIYQGKAVLVRYLWLNIKPDSCRWEQAFSTDGGKTWETNWTTDLERITEPQSG
jgi:hypothetical protein